MNQTDLEYGWKLAPNGRGTFDILWSSVITIFLCSWSVLTLNVYPRRFNYFKISGRKSVMTFLGCMGPEFILQLAAGQYCAARRSVHEFSVSNQLLPGRQPWTMKHAFFANMGGFALQTQVAHKGAFPLFPLNAQQILYLVENDYIGYNDVCIEKELIRDRDKVDGIVRLITVCQISWFFVTCVARACQHIAVTVLELAVVGFMLNSLCTFFFWWHKPNDITRAIILRPNTEIDLILRQAGDVAREPYRDTPLDFVGYDWWSWTFYWTYWKGLVRIIFRIDLDERRRPIEAIPDDNFPKIDGWPQWIVMIFQIGYGGVHLFGWGFPFPTQAEKHAWRIATVTIIMCIFIPWAVEILAWRINISVAPIDVSNLASTEAILPASTSASTSTAAKTRRKTWKYTIRNLTFPRDPLMDIPLRVLVPVTVPAAIYCFARAYIVIEGFIGLRALPPSAYQSVDWTFITPHWM